MCPPATAPNSPPLAAAQSQAPVVSECIWLRAPCTRSQDLSDQPQLPEKLHETSKAAMARKLNRETCLKKSPLHYGLSNGTGSRLENLALWEALRKDLFSKFSRVETKGPGKSVICHPLLRPGTVPARTHLQSNKTAA